LALLCTRKQPLLFSFIGSARVHCVLAGCVIHLVPVVRSGICRRSDPLCLAYAYPRSGCGPIGLITAAVAHAYSARKIIAFDVNPGRVDFAKKYISPLTGKPIIDHVFHIAPLPSSKRSDTPNGLSSHIGEAGTGGGITDGEVVEGHEEETESDMKWGWAKKRMAEILEQVGLVDEEGVDRVIEASGSEDAMLHGVAIAKQGATCERGLSSAVKRSPLLTQRRPPGWARSYSDQQLPHSRRDQQGARREG
jgi:D-xylulose reductase